jgi:SNF2 family DNA or RNA helicase
VLCNYDILEAHADCLGACELRATVFDESHYCKDPRRKRTKAAIGLAEGIAADGLRLSLTGTPILNRPKDLIAQLRLIGRVGDFGSGASLGRRFRGAKALDGCTGTSVCTAAAHVLGNDTLADRAAAVDDFQRADAPGLIVCSLQAASQGITLVRASNVAFVKLDWTPARHDQAEDRCHRIGQHDAVTAYYLLASQTIDEQMAGVLQRKRAVIDAVTDGQRFEDSSALDAVVHQPREADGATLRATA